MSSAVVISVAATEEVRRIIMSDRSVTGPREYTLLG
jgi:hypothetical protein